MSAVARGAQLEIEGSITLERAGRMVQIDCSGGAIVVRVDRLRDALAFGRTAQRFVGIARRAVPAKREPPILPATSVEIGGVEVARAAAGPLGTARVRVLWGRAMALLIRGRV